MKQNLWRYWEAIREKRPLIHCMTNYVTNHWVADMVMAAGARPIMAENSRDVKELVPHVSALLLNIGMLTEDKVNSMILALRLAEEHGIPVVLDPVGAGALSWRREVAATLLQTGAVTLLRGNRQEVQALTQYMLTASNIEKDISSPHFGVDAGTSPLEDGKLYQDMQKLSEKTGAVIVKTGEVDVVIHKKSMWKIENGTEALSFISGSGCQLSALLAAALGGMEGSHQGRTVEASVLGVSLLGLAGERAWDRTKNIGPMVFQMALIDEVYAMEKDVWQLRARYEELA